MLTHSYDKCKIIQHNQGRSQEFDLGEYKWICPGSRRQNNHI